MTASEKVRIERLIESIKHDLQVVSSAFPESNNSIAKKREEMRIAVEDIEWIIKTIS